MSHTSDIPVIGIDLGTTFCAVATIGENGQPIVLENSNKKNLTPSVLAFKPDQIAFGDNAKELQSFGEGNIASFFKRQMGNSSFYLEFFGKRYDATALSGLLLGKLKADAEATLGQKVSKAVITVPAYFNDLQRKATIEAGKLAGLEVLRIINEPTAAAIAYGINKSRGDQTLLVYDLGGGTFDVTLLRTIADSIKVIATDGDHQLGGKDWDDRIMQYVCDQFKAEFSNDPTTNVDTLNNLIIQCENAKKSLSELSSAQIRIDFDHDKGRYTITREHFDAMTIDLLERTKTRCDTVLTEAGLTWSDLDGVLLVGGSTRMPQIVSAVESMSGKKAIHGINIDEAVAVGAAIQAKMDITPDKLPGNTTVDILPGMVPGDVVSHSLGVIAGNHDNSKYINAIILRRNTPIPGQQTRPLTFRTSAKEDLELDVYLLQGESENPHECTIPGRYVFSDIMHEKNGQAVLDITYSYDKSGVISVSGIQQSTGKPLTMRVEPVPSDMSWIDKSPRDREGTAPGHVSVMIAVDCSGSMYIDNGDPMRKTQEAAKKFLEKIDLTHFSVGIIACADKTKVLVKPSQNSKEIEKGIKSLFHYDGVGFGNADQPFTEAKKILDSQEGAKFLLVLTDGEWNYQNDAIKEAKKCHAAEIGVAAIGFGDADKRFLQKIASCDENAVFTDRGGIINSFSTIGQVLMQSGGLKADMFSSNNR